MGFMSRMQRGWTVKWQTTSLGKTECLHAVHTHKSFRQQSYFLCKTE